MPDGGEREFVNRDRADGAYGTDADGGQDGGEDGGDGSAEPINIGYAEEIDVIGEQMADSYKESLVGGTWWDWKDETNQFPNDQHERIHFYYSCIVARRTAIHPHKVVTSMGANAWMPQEAFRKGAQFSRGWLESKGLWGDDRQLGVNRMSHAWSDFTADWQGTAGGLNPLETCQSQAWNYR